MEIDLETLKKLYGSLDSNVKFIENEYGVRIRASSDGVEVIGPADKADEALKLIAILAGLIKDGVEIDRQKIRQCMNMADKPAEIAEMNRDTVAVTAKGRHIKCKTLGQKEYVKAIKTNTVVFGVGPAGTGKTYLAVALAYMTLKAEKAEKIILTRPALEAGEKLGFLPGDLQDKIDPYLRPLYDALNEMFGLDSYQKLIERGIIEVAPLAYMRGRTLSNAFIILDEAQNATEEQMKMFLTRLGHGSKMVITGDDTQVDLPYGKNSGLRHAASLLAGVEDIAVCHLTDKDVVRHELVQRIVQAYAKANEKKPAKEVENE